MGLKFEDFRIKRASFTGRTILWLLGAVISIAGGVLILKAVLQDPESAGPREVAAAPVVVERVGLYLFADIIEAIGTANANESVTLTAQISDTVKAIHFADGATVEAGTILVTLTNAEELANVSAALASYTEAKNQYDRTKTLVDQGNLSQASMDAATRALDEAQAQLNAARARAGDYVISAPFAGILGLRQVSPGALVSPGTPITTLDDISIIKLDFSVPEKFLSTIAPGQEIVAVAAAYPGREFRGLVTTIDSRVDPVTRALIVRAEIDNPDSALRPGMLLTVDLISNLAEALSLPEKALIPIGDDQFIFIVTPDETAERIEVIIGRRYRDRVEILSGLGEDDIVVTAGTLRLRPGAKVNIQTEEAAPPYPEDLLVFWSAQGQSDDPL